MTDQLALELQHPRAKRAQRVHANSAEAHRGSIESLSKRAWLVLAWLERAGPSTDRQIQAGLNLPEPGCVRPRVTELCDAGLLRECGTTRCTLTGKTVRLVEACNARA